MLLPIADRKSKVRTFEQLIHSLPAILRAAEDSTEVQTAACVAAWNHVVGETLRNSAVVVELSEERLTIAVADGIWQRQLQPMEDQLIYRLNSVLGQPLVRSIEFRIAPQVLAHNLRRRGASKVELTKEEPPPEIIFAASSIKDPKLRRAFVGAANRCLNQANREE